MSSLPGSRELDAYREDAHRFLAALNEEYYLHYAGLKDRLELEPIFERYADLTALDACGKLGAAAGGEDAPRSARELWRFACEGHLSELTRGQAEEIARLQASLEAEIDGEPVGFRQLRPRLANEPDRGRRARIEAARLELVEEHLNPVHVAAFETQAAGTRRLGSSTYLALYEGFGFPLARLADECRSLLAETEDLYVRAFDRLLRVRLGLGLEEARRWDVPRLFRAPEWDTGFSAGGMVPALEGTLAGLGVDLRAQRNVHLDLEPRPTKSPRAFCAPIEVPGRVMLVIQPIGGADDWRALFHEAGHAEHFAHTSASLPLEARRLGDNAVTEAWAFLLEHLVSDPVWLTRRLDFGRPEEFERESAAVLLYMTRRYAAKLLYELELHGSGQLAAMRPRYVELLTEATKIEYNPADFLADVDTGFYASAYLRAWALEAGVSASLRERFGSAWFGEQKAGSLLRELWHEGQGLTAEELLAELTGGRLALGRVAERAREVLSLS